jgi:hypothetical protein
MPFSRITCSWRVGRPMNTTSGRSVGCLEHSSDGTAAPRALGRRPHGAFRQPPGRTAVQPAGRASAHAGPSRALTDRHRPDRRSAVGTDRASSPCPESSARRPLRACPPHAYRANLRVVTPLPRHHHAPATTQLRMLRRRPAAAVDPGAHLHLRMHVLRVLCQWPLGRHLPELQWRTAAAATPAGGQAGQAPGIDRARAQAGRMRNDLT